MDPITPPTPNLPPEIKRNNNGLIIFIAFDLLVTAALGFGIYYYFANIPPKEAQIGTLKENNSELNRKVDALQAELELQKKQNENLAKATVTITGSQPVVSATTTETVTTTTTTDQPEASQPASNEFTTKTVKIGDKIAGMELVKITVASAEYSKLADDNLTAQFRGEATLSGTYTHDSEDSMLGEQVCFSPDQASAKLLPRVIGESRDPYGFCFSNLDEAKKQFPKVGASGQINVKISDFEVVVYPGEGSNWAKLVEVIK
jgi:hypothetical protein